MSENLTVCPDCGESFETTDESKDMPIQGLAQSCPSCRYTVDIAILNYYDGTYEVIAPNLDGDQCIVCEGDATMRAQRIGEPIKGWCGDHAGAHRQTALSFATE